MDVVHMIRENLVSYFLSFLSPGLDAVQIPDFFLFPFMFFLFPQKPTPHLHFLLYSSLPTIKKNPLIIFLYRIMTELVR
jgi:hypothetical protein